EFNTGGGICWIHHGAYMHQVALLDVANIALPTILHAIELEGHGTNAARSYSLSQVLGILRQFQVELHALLIAGKFQVAFGVAVFAHVIMPPTEANGLVLDATAARLQGVVESARNDDFREAPAMLLDGIAWRVVHDGVAGKMVSILGGRFS